MPFIISWRVQAAHLGVVHHIHPFPKVSVVFLYTSYLRVDDAVLPLSPRLYAFFPAPAATRPEPRACSVHEGFPSPSHVTGLGRTPPRQQNVLDAFGAAGVRLVEARRNSAVGVCNVPLARPYTPLHAGAPPILARARHSCDVAPALASSVVHRAYGAVDVAVRAYVAHRACVAPRGGDGRPLYVVRHAYGAIRNPAGGPVPEPVLALAPAAAQQRPVLVAQHPRDLYCVDAGC